MSISDDLREMADWLDAAGAEQWNNQEHASGQVQLIGAPLDLFAGADAVPYEDHLHVHRRFGPFSVVQVATAEEWEQTTERCAQFDLLDEKDRLLDALDEAS